MRTKMLPGELDRCTAKLIEIYSEGPDDMRSTQDINEGTPVGWCLGADHEGDKWYLVTDGELGDGAREETENLAYLYNAVPVLVDALKELADFRNLVEALEPLAERVSETYGDCPRSIQKLYTVYRAVLDAQGE